MGGLLCGGFNLYLAFGDGGDSGGTPLFLSISAVFLIGFGWLAWKGEVLEKQRNEYGEGHTAVEARVLHRDEEVIEGDGPDIRIYHLVVQFDTDAEKYQLHTEVQK